MVENRQTCLNRNVNQAAYRWKKYDNHVKYKYKQISVQMEENKLTFPNINMNKAAYRQQKIDRHIQMNIKKLLKDDVAKKWTKTSKN